MNSVISIQYIRNMCKYFWKKNSGNEGSTVSTRYNFDTYWCLHVFVTPDDKSQKHQARVLFLIYAAFFIRWAINVDTKCGSKQEPHLL